jgi:hypothetical protein
MAKTPAKKTSKDIQVKFSAMGQESSKKTVKKGFTLGDAKAKWNLQGLTVKVNGTDQHDSYVLGANDAIVAVPQVKGGLR